MSGGSTRDAERSIRLVPGPEPLGILVAAVVTLAFLVLGGGLSGGGATPGPTATPPGSRTAAPSEAPNPSGDGGGDVVAGLLAVINERLIQHGDALTRELARDPLRPERLADVIGEMRATARLGTDTVGDLRPRPGAPTLGRDLAALYADVDRVASDTLTAAVDEPAAYGSGGSRLLQVLEGLPPLQRTLVAGASPGPSPGGPPAGEEIENGGFEEGVGAPWRLSLADGALATLRSVTTLPAAGSRAARIEVLTATEARGAISLRQAGLEVEAGRTYVVAIAVRATADREVRVRIASASGEAYASRIVDAGIAWNADTWAFTAPATDPAAVIEIDLGRSMEAVWIDGVSFRPR